MANSGTSWTSPPFMASDIGFDKTSMPLSQPVGESFLMKQCPHAEVGLSEKQERDDGVLSVTIHQAKHIHNISTYGNQDVYAKFLLTHNKDMVYSTQSVRAASQNPVFNQTLEIPVNGQDSVLKCEIWMMSCTQDCPEDRLLGFVLVPLKNLYGIGKQTHEYCLTSTDHFYTPAGTVHLSLSFPHNKSIAARGAVLPAQESKVSFCSPPTSDFQQEVMVDCEHQSVVSANMCKVEFLDLEAAVEDQHLVSLYYKMANGSCFEERRKPDSSSLRPGLAETVTVQTGHGILYEKPHAMYATPFEIKEPLPVVPLVQTNTSSVSGMDDKMDVSPRGKERMCTPSFIPGLEKLSKMQEVSNVAAVNEGTLVCVEIQPPCSQQATAACSDKVSSFNVLNEMEHISAEASACCEPCQVLPDNACPVNTCVESETTFNQEHFVDLYLKSMQQFTNKLVNMKYAFDIDSKDLAALRSVQVDRKAAEGKQKEGSKLYYGSRVFY